MNVAGSLVLNAAPAGVLRLLADPERLSALLPNVDQFGWSEGATEGSFAVTIRPALGLGEIPVRTVWQRIDSASQEQLRYRIDGRTDEQRVAFDVLLTVAAADGASSGARGDAADAGGEGPRARGDAADLGGAGSRAAGDAAELAGASLVSWSLDCHVTGTLRSAGQRVLVPIVDRQVRAVLGAAEGALR